MKNPNLLKQLEELEATIIELRFQAEEGYDDMVRLTLTFLRHQVEMLERVYNRPTAEGIPEAMMGEPFAVFDERPSEMSAGAFRKLQRRLERKGFYNKPDGGWEEYEKSFKEARLPRLSEINAEMIKNRKRSKKDV